MTDAHKPSRHLVEPMTLKGFRDYLPDEMIARNQVVEKIRRVYEKYGFQPIDTPILEYLVTLIGTGGEETNKQLFRLDSPEREPIAMRFDLTVPFARVLAQYPDKLKLPFRRYHIGPVFRVDKPDKGRYRQFTQFDIDAAGSASVVVDAEIIAAMCEALVALGLQNDGSRKGQRQEFVIRMNNRKLMDALLDSCGITDSDVQKHVLRVIDKLQKVGLENVRKELGEGRIDESGDPIRGVGLQGQVIDQTLQVISVRGNRRSEVIHSLAALLPDSPSSRHALEEMKALADALDALGVKESEAIFDPSLARGLDYYTGPVFEANLLQAPEFGSIMGGGRFDHLVERFLDTPIPATGASIGLDRLVAALSAVGKITTKPTTTEVIVLTLKDVPVVESLKLAKQLRDENIATEIYMGDPDATLRDQLSYANAKEIPVAVIMGPDELKAGTVSVKNLVSGRQQRATIADRQEYVKAGKTAQVTIERTQLVATVRQMLPER